MHRATTTSNCVSIRSMATVTYLQEYLRAGLSATLLLTSAGSVPQIYVALQAVWLCALHRIMIHVTLVLNSSHHPMVIDGQQRTGSSGTSTAGTGSPFLVGLL